VVRATVKTFMMMNSGLYIWVSSNEKKYLKKELKEKSMKKHCATPPV
jgi:hypothetical protein